MDLGVWRKPAGLLYPVRCWQCGVEPEDMEEIGSAAGPVRFVPRWPAGDHEHAEREPTAEELLDAGAAALLRIQAAG